MKYSGTENPDIDKEMVCVKVEIRERMVVRRVRITAGSLERALSMAGESRPDREVSLVSPMDAERISSRAAFAEAA